MPKEKTLNWEYCECGCHGSELRIGGEYFWSLTDWPEKNGKPDYDKPMFHLNDGHKYGKHLGTFKTSEERDEHVRGIIRKHMEELKKAL